MRRFWNSDMGGLLNHAAPGGHDQRQILAVSAGMGIMLVTFSPPEICRIFTMAVPRAVRPGLGNLVALDLIHAAQVR